MTCFRTKCLAQWFCLNDMAQIYKDVSISLFIIAMHGSSYFRRNAAEQSLLSGSLKPICLLNLFSLNAYFVFLFVCVCVCVCVCLHIILFIQRNTTPLGPIQHGVSESTVESIRRRKVSNWQGPGFQSAAPTTHL